MNRIFMGTLVSVALIGAAAAASAPSNTTTAKPAPASSAITTAPAAPATTPAPAPDYAAQCKGLTVEWKTAAEANATNKKFAQAKSNATKAERNCKSTKVSLLKKGSGQYQTALKLLGVTPTL
ncbi:MAG: hypothetical protein ABL973_15375 [Micropepsaceae bacterium]